MLLTKIHIPSPGKNLIHRSILFDKLDEGLTRKLILVSAPAGFGKTTLISDWINQHKIPTAWFSLDKGDNDPVGFVNYIISGVQGINEEFGISALRLLKSSNKSSAESIICLLINDILNIDQDFLLVLDDFHLINNSEIQEMISYFLENMPNNIHVVISTRSDPALNLARLRSQNKLIELRSSELSFSANDISVLFNSRLKFGLSVQDISVLKAKTEGWIAGLQLAALSMQGYENKPGFIEAFAGNNRYIMDYLIEEVLKIQSDEIKEFLLKTSVLKQISAPLCNTVLNRNDSQLILERLEKNNMFVFPLDEERNWYRYHHLFAELLKQRLLLTDKNTIEELHNRACAWFEHAKMYDLAIEHALEINDYNKSLQLLGEIVEGMWENGHHSAIMKYGDLLPEELIKKNPEFCLYYSWILIIAGQIQNAQPFLESAEQITLMNINDGNLSSEDIQYNRKRLGKISVAFAYLMSNTEHSGKIFEYCKVAMEYLSEDDSLWYSWGWFSYGLAYFSIGDLNESNKALWKALEHGKKAGNIYLISTITMRLADNEQQLGHYKLAYKICSDHLTLMQESGYSKITTADWTYAGMYSMMAVTEHMWADLDSAHKNIKIAYALSEKGKDVMLQASILAVYSIVLQDQGDMDGAGKLINELEDILKQYKISPYMTLLLVAWKVIIFTRLGQIDQANSLLDEYDIKAGNKISYVNEVAYVAYTRLLLVQGKFPEAESVLGELHVIIDAGKRVERLIELKICYAILFNMKDQHEKAVTSLVSAIELAAPENLAGFFIFSFDYLHDLLKEIFNIQAIKNNIALAEFIEKLKKAIEKREKQTKVNLLTEISTRELDILKLIADNLSNQEIADKLFLSINTVKSHVKNILLKLDSENRSKAVAKARKTGII